MWVKKDFVKFILLLQFFILSTSSSTSSSLHLNENETETDDVNSFSDNESLPNIWEDEVVTRMVREVVARDLMREHEFQRSKRQYKRDVQSSVTLAPKIETAGGNNYKANTKTTTRRMTTQKGKKPAKVTQTGNKNKNRVTSPPITTTTTKATVKPSNVKPSLGSVNASIKIKVRCLHTN